MGSVCTSNQEYRVTSKIDGRTSYFTNQRVGNVTLNITIDWKDKGYEEYRPTQDQGVELKITGSNGEVYDFTINSSMLSNNQTSMTFENNGVIWTFTKVDDYTWTASATLIKYDEKNGVAISYFVEEVGRDIANERITFNNQDYYISYANDEYIVSELRNKDIQNVIFTNIIDKTTELVIYKVWCDDALKNMRPDLNFTIYTKDGEEYVEYVENTICTREKVYNDKPYTVWKITYSNLPVYNLQTCELIEYYATENSLESSFYKETYYYHANDETSGIDKAIIDLDDTSYNSDNYYQLEFLNSDENKYLTNNDCVINKIYDIVDYSFAKKWTGFDGIIDENISELTFKFSITCTIKNTASYNNGEDISYIYKTIEKNFDVPLNNDNVYSESFPKYDAYGHRCVYTITEQVFKKDGENVTGIIDITDKIFDISISNQREDYSIITNNYNGVKNKGSIAVSKIWNNIQIGNAYPKMIFELYRLDGSTEILIDTVEIPSGTLSESTSSQAVFEDILIYSPNGDKYKYIVKEKTSYPAYDCTKIMVNDIAVQDLTNDIQLECGDKISFTNTLTTSFSMTKQWIGSVPSNGTTANFELIYKVGKDGSWNQYTDESLKSNVHITLDGVVDTFDDNTLVYETTPEGNTVWSAIWTKLPKYAIKETKDDNGNIVSTLEEIYYSAIEVDDNGNPIDNDTYTVETKYQIDDAIGNIINQTTQSISVPIKKDGIQTIPNDEDWEEVQLMDTINNLDNTPYLVGDIFVDYSNNSDKSNNTTNEVILYANTYSGKILNLPKYDIDGNEYTYIAVEQQGNTSAYKWQYYGNDTFSYWFDDTYQDATTKFNFEDNQWEVCVTNRLIIGSIEVIELFKDTGNRMYDTNQNQKLSENVDTYRPENVKIDISATYSCPTNNGYK